MNYNTSQVFFKKIIKTLSLKIKLHFINVTRISFPCKKELLPIGGDSLSPKNNTTKYKFQKLHTMSTNTLGFFIEV